MLSKQDYVVLSNFRFHLARFLRFSETASRAAGFTPKTPVIEIFGICVNCRAA